MDPVGGRGCVRSLHRVARGRDRRAVIKFCSIVKLTARHSKVENLEYRVTSAAGDEMLSTKRLEGVYCGKGVNEVSEGGHCWRGRAKIMKSMDSVSLPLTHGYCGFHQSSPVSEVVIASAKHTGHYHHNPHLRISLLQPLQPERTVQVAQWSRRSRCN